MDQLPKLGVCVDLVSHRHWLGEDSSAQPNEPSKATSSSTRCGTVNARQGPGKCGRESLGRLAAFLALALQQHSQQSALRKSRG